MKKTSILFCSHFKRNFFLADKVTRKLNRKRVNNFWLAFICVFFIPRSFPFTSITTLLMALVRSNAIPRNNAQSDLFQYFLFYNYTCARNCVWVKCNNATSTLLLSIVDCWCMELDNRILILSAFTFHSSVRITMLKIWNFLWATLSNQFCFFSPRLNLIKLANIHIQRFRVKK